MIEIYTDGACKGNPGPGGWAAVIIEEGKKRRLSGHEQSTTNNRMEIMGVIKGLEQVPEDSEVAVHSDSQYVVNTLNQKWKRRKNQDLWEKLDDLAVRRHVTFKWVRGHVGHPLNEEADTLANREAGLNGGPSMNIHPSPIPDNRVPKKWRLTVHSYLDNHKTQGKWSVVLVNPEGHIERLENVTQGLTLPQIQLVALTKGLEKTPEGSTISILTSDEILIYLGTGKYKRRQNLDYWEKVDALMSKRVVMWELIKEPDKAEPAPKPGQNPISAEQPKEISRERVGSSLGDQLTHMDESGKARMVDVSAKGDTEREAIAKGSIVMKPETLKLIQEKGIEKGDVLAVARVAGIMAAKRTSDLIPMCHPLMLTHVQVDFEPDQKANAIHMTATIRTTGKTGVEMEALTAVTVAALTIYDMAKAVDRGMRIEKVRLVRKSGGKSGLIELE